jgi:predicted unusual protein kinase regulating ubiquinone biosynthesis (AarF/ABC1/UbiB family)
MILLLMAFWQQDASLLTDAILMLSRSTDRSDLDVIGFSADLQALMNRVRGSAIKDIQLGLVMQDMLDIAFRYGVPIPASLALTVKALAQMQSAAAQLDPNVDPFEVAGRFITRSTMRHVLGKADPKMLFYEMQKMKFRAARLLEALERLVGARPGEKLEVNFKGTSLEDTIWSAGRQLAIGVVGGFALLASAITSNARGGNDRWSIAFGAAGLASVAVLIVGFARGRRARGRTSARTTASHS